MALKIYAAKAYKPSVLGIIRDLRPTWLLEELGAPYERISLDPTKAENKGEYLKTHPFGKVPALDDDGFVIFESAAICEYIAEKYQRFIPAHQTQEYHLHRQWCYFAVSNIEPHATRIFAADHFYDPSESTSRIRQLGVEGLERFLPALNHQLAQPTLLKSGFSVADILLTTSLRFTKTNAVYEKYPNVLKYVEVNSARPAFQRAHELNGK